MKSSENDCFQSFCYFPDTERVMNCCAGRTYDRFIADSKLADACVFNLSQLGELCRLVDPAFAKAHPQVPWREMQEYNTVQRHWS